MTINTLEVPDGILAHLKDRAPDPSREVRLAAAIHWYSQAWISQEKAAEFAGLDRIDFLKELARRNVDVFVVDFDDLKSEPARG